MIVSKGKWIRLKKLDPPVKLGGLFLPDDFKNLTRAEWMIAGVSKGIDNKYLRLGHKVLIKNQTVQEIETKKGPEYFVHEKNIHALVTKVKA